jgi:hypothetical protein
MREHDKIEVATDIDDEKAERAVKVKKRRGKAGSSADEIVGGYRPAVIGPAAQAPIIDVTGGADEGLEALRPACWGELGRP